MNADAGIARLRAWVWLGHLLFLGLFILSVLHYRERVVHVDSALQIFKWVQKGGVEVEAHRYTAVFPQLVVKLFRLMGAPLSMLLATASAMHVVVAWLIYALAAHACRVPWVAAASALAAVLCTRLTFYGIVLEANYLLSYPFLLAAVVAGPLAHGKQGSLWMALGALALVLLVHPVGFLVAGYMLLFLAVTHAAVRLEAIGLAVLALLWGLVGRALLPPSGYESGLYEAAFTGWSRPSEWLSSPALDFLMRHSWQDTALYLPAWVLLALTLVLLFRRGAWPLALLVLVGAGGYLLLNVATYQHGETAMMMEKNFLPLATLIAVPLLFEAVIVRVHLRSVAWLGFAIVLLLQFRTISFASRQAGERYAALAELVDDIRQAGIRKAIVSEADLTGRSIGVAWALPFETLLISALDGPDQCVTAALDDDAIDLERIEGVYLMPWTAELPVQELRDLHFQLPSGQYQYFGRAAY